MDMEEIKYSLYGKEDDFGKYFKKLLEASYSVLDCLGSGLYDCHPSIEEIERDEGQKIEDFLTEETVVKALVKNSLFHRPTCNGVGWGACEIDVSSYGVDYVTSGGLAFGWTVMPKYVGQGDVKRNDTLEVYCYARPGGTLEESLIENGFTDD